MWLFIVSLERPSNRIGSVELHLNMIWLGASIIKTSAIILELVGEEKGSEMKGNTVREILKYGALFFFVLVFTEKKIVERKK